MQLRVVVLVIGLMVVCYIGPAAQRATERLATYHRDVPQEKVYIHTDKSQYVLGERLWGRVYLLDAIFHQTLTPSQQVYVELFDPQNALRYRRLIRVTEGGGALDLFLQPAWGAGNYLLRVYTSYQRNFVEPFFYQREIPVHDAFAGLGRQTLQQTMRAEPVAGEPPVGAAKRISVKFYPEGGHLVAGLRSQLGIRAVGPDGRGVAVAGSILANGQLVSRFATHPTGLGVCALTPEVGKTYQAVIEADSGQVYFDFPGVEESGVTMQLDQRGDSLLIGIQTNIPGGLNGAYLVGHLRGELFGLLQNLEGPAVRYLLPLAEVPDGVLHFTLFSNESNPLCERLIFHYLPERQPQVTLKTDRPQYSKRERVALDISVASPHGEPVPVSGSISVTDMAAVPRHPGGSDIRTYLLLESDLHGAIHNPGYYFAEATPSRKRLLDALMLTHGWRRFDWESVLRGDAPKLQWAPENDIRISGQVIKKSNDEPVRANVYLSTLSEEFVMQEKVTNARGEFAFDGLHLNDSVTLMIQADIYKEGRKDAMDKKRARKGQGPVGNRQVKISLDPVIIPEPDRLSVPAIPGADSSTLMAFLEASRRIQTVDSAYADMLNVQLDEVVIAEQSIDEEAAYLKGRGSLYHKPDQRLVIDSLPTGQLATNVFDLIKGRFPGVEIVGTFPEKTARIRGFNSLTLNTTALILLDGMPVEPSLANV
ncbi:MAG: hypothetical protein R3330_03805, partial [Saprospiraceae bacterium]|nr:hypothetical protein [Saprospiraceae bacterium]